MFIIQNANFDSTWSCRVELCSSQVYFCSSCIFQQDLPSPRTRQLHLHPPPLRPWNDSGEPCHATINESTTGVVVDQQLATGFGPVSPLVIVGDHGDR